ncbi:hypothetical protein Tco_1577579 [Tanacetum coccineum]
MKEAKEKVSSSNWGVKKMKVICRRASHDQDDHNHTAFVYEDFADLERKSDETEHVIIEEEKDTSERKSDETEQSNSSNSRRLPEEQFKDDEFLADISLNISRPRGLSIPGPMQSQPQQPTQTTDPKEKGQGGTNPGDAGVSQTPSSYVENLKLPTKGDVRIKEPTSSAGTLSSMKNLDKDLSFTDQFLVKKSREDEPEKTNTEAEVQSMVTVPILQDTSSVPLMTTPVIDITDPQSDSITVPASMPTTTTVTDTTTTTVPPPPPQPQQEVSTSILIQTIGQLEQNIVDLVEANQALEERLDKKGTGSTNWRLNTYLD